MNLVFLLSFLQLYVYHSEAYGEIGHKLIARIAESLLTNKAAARSVMGCDISKVNCFEEVASWADYNDVVKESHYFNGAEDDNPPYRCITNIDQLVCQNNSNCILDAIPKYALQLQAWKENQQRNYNQTQEALKYLIHLVGDMHQPLHFTKMKNGGNNQKVLLSQYMVKLHNVWDIHFIHKKLKDMEEGKVDAVSPESSYSFQVYFEQLFNNSSQYFKAEWEKWTSNSFIDFGVISKEWAREVHNLNCKMGIWGVKDVSEEMDDYDHQIKKTLQQLQMVKNAYTTFRSEFIGFQKVLNRTQVYEKVKNIIINQTHSSDEYLINETIKLVLNPSDTPNIKDEMKKLKLEKTQYFQEHDLNNNYYQTFIPVIDELLAKAGARLGFLLESIFGANNPQNLERN